MVDFKKKHSENWVICYYEQQGYEVKTWIMWFWTIKGASNQSGRDLQSMHEYISCHSFLWDMYRPHSLFTY